MTCVDVQLSFSQNPHQELKLIEKCKKKRFINIITGSRRRGPSSSRPWELVIFNGIHLKCSAQSIAININNYNNEHLLAEHFCEKCKLESYKYIKSVNYWIWGQDLIFSLLRSWWLHLRTGEDKTRFNQWRHEGMSLKLTGAEISFQNKTGSAWRDQSRVLWH